MEVGIEAREEGREAEGRSDERVVAGCGGDPRCLRGGVAVDEGAEGLALPSETEHDKQQQVARGKLSRVLVQGHRRR
jgi:hypothetical protein